MKTPKQFLQEFGQSLSLFLWSVLHRYQHSEGDITLYDHLLWWIDDQICHLWDLSYFGSDKEVFDVLDWGWEMCNATDAQYLTERQRFCRAIASSIH